tara:strand:+ start:434 stop:640 length:207 start_codon:yes stop_codon:yes gene_type:complete
MKWILILFLSTGEEIVYGEVEACIINDIWNKVEIYEQEHNIDLQGWGCYDEETFKIRENARKRLGIDV